MNVGDVVVSVTTGREHRVVRVSASGALVFLQGVGSVNINPATGLPVGYALKEAA
jgi:hypothetical protein